MITRRKVLLALGTGAFAAPLAGYAQQQSAKVPRIGMLLPNAPANTARNPRIAAFFQGLRDLAWIEGKTVFIEYRWAEGELGRLAELATDLVRLKVDVIVITASPAAKAAKNATSTIPIVILDPGDPVAIGLVVSLARPGGNVTGITSIAPQLAAKRLALLREAAPVVTRVAVLFDAATPPAEVAMKELQAAAQVLGLRMRSEAIQNPKNLAETFATITAERADGLIVFPDPFFIAQARRIAEKEMIPKLSRVAVLWNPQGPASTLNWKEIQLPARQLEVQLHSLEVRSPDDFEKAFENAARARAGAIAITPHPMFATNLKRIADLAAKSRLPSIFQYSEFADAGGLVTYGTDRADLFRRAATFVDKILKGANPGDLPMEQPTKFELVVNMKTASALGIKIPQSILQRADKVIE